MVLSDEGLLNKPEYIIANTQVFVVYLLSTLLSYWHKHCLRPVFVLLASFAIHREILTILSGCLASCLAAGINTLIV
jgi:hypothetical protein